jgi:N-acetylneuraminic acid mutarotase
MTAHSGGQLWIFGGEFASASESQFHHYRDLWAFHFGSKRWEKVLAASGNPPTSRSGHRMVLQKRHLVIFGGFHDNLSECKYFNDVHVFSLEERIWRKVTVTGTAPGPRSGCCMVPLQDGRILVYGGFCKEKKTSGGRKKGDSEAGKTMADMYLLVPESK